MPWARQNKGWMKSILHVILCGGGECHDSQESLPQLQVIYNLNFIKVTLEFFPFEASKHTILPKESEWDRKIIEAFFVPLLLEKVHKIESDLHRNRIEDIISLRTALTVVRAEHWKKNEVKMSLSELHFSIYSREHLYRLM